MSRSFLAIGAVICLAAVARASPITPTPDEEAARTALGNRLPDAKLLWVSGDKIYYSPVNNFAPQLVTEGAIPEGNPRWSPDGTKILYVKDPKGVWIMNADFSNRTEVIPDGDTASWTRDGLSITAVNANDRRQILKYDLSGGNPYVIYDSSDGDYSGETYAGSEHSQAAELHVSGRYILTFTLDQNHNTFIVDLQGKQHLYNSDMDRGDCSPAWAPDGTYTTTTARTSNRPVLKTNFEASGPTLASSSDHFVGIGDVCSCAYYVHGHRVSNDGQWVAMGGLNRDESNREIYIWKIGEAESAVVRMTFETAEDKSPSLWIGQPADCQDADGDGYGQGADCTGPDCDDSSRDVHPGASERCNNVDDDCDSQTDEDFPTLGESCQEGLGACQASGQIVCQSDGSGVECDAEPGQPSQEVCEGSVDEDCDGTVDNGCDCNDGDSRPCYGGPDGTEGVGECKGGTQSCSGGSWGACEGQVLPQAENCSDSLDNDCDGLTDTADSEDCGGGEDGGTEPDTDTDPDTDTITDAGGDPVIKGACNCGVSSPPDQILLVAALFILWRRKIRHAK